MAFVKIHAGKKSKETKKVLQNLHHSASKTRCQKEARGYISRTQLKANIAQSNQLGMK